MINIDIAIAIIFQHRATSISWYFLLVFTD